MIVLSPKAGCTNADATSELVPVEPDPAVVAVDVVRQRTRGAATDIPEGRGYLPSTEG